MQSEWIQGNKIIDFYSASSAPRWEIEPKTKVIQALHEQLDTKNTKGRSQR